MPLVDSFVTCPDPDESLCDGYRNLLVPAVKRLATGGNSASTRDEILAEFSPAEVAAAWLWMRRYRWKLFRRSNWWPYLKRERMLRQAWHWCNAGERALRMEIDLRISQSTVATPGQRITFADAYAWSKDAIRQAESRATGARS